MLIVNHGSCWVLRGLSLGGLRDRVNLILNHYFWRLDVTTVDVEGVSRCWFEVRGGGHHLSLLTILWDDLIEPLEHVLYSIVELTNTLLQV